MLRTLLALALLSACPLAARADGCDDAKAACDQQTARCDNLNNTVPRNTRERSILNSQKSACSDARAARCDAYAQCQRDAKEAAAQAEAARRAAEEAAHDAGPPPQPSAAPPVDAGPRAPPPLPPLADEELRQTVLAAQDRFAICIRENLAQAPRGSYALQLRVEPDGSVSRFQAVGPLLESKEVAACFQRVGQSLKFRRAPQPREWKQTLSY